MCAIVGAPVSATSIAHIEAQRSRQLRVLRRVALGEPAQAILHRDGERRDEIDLAFGPPHVALDHPVATLLQVVRRHPLAQRTEALPIAHAGTARARRTGG